jgi:glycosyltransferase involved in cell wall biosynthesis
MTEAAMDRQRRIVFAWNYTLWGGAQVYLLAVMKLVKEVRPDWDMHVILPAASTPQIFTYLDQLGVSYEAVARHLDDAPAPTLARKLSRQLNRLKVEYATFNDLRRYDVETTAFHIDIAPWQSVAFLTAMSLRGAQVFLTLHNFLPDGFPLRRWLWKLRIRFTSYLPGFHIFASNNDTKNRLKGWVNDRFWERMRVTFTAVNPPEIEAARDSDFDRGAERLRLGLDPEAFLVLAVGNFVDRKGRWVFLDAARKVVERDAGINFAWLTPVMPSERDVNKIGDFGLGKSFRLVHSSEVGTERSDILKFFRIADAFTLPSYVEGLPIALLEAMALGLPSISTNVYAIPEAIVDGETGILIEAGDAEALAEAVLKMRTDVPFREAVAGKGRQHVLRNFDERDAARSVIEAYEEALDGR